MTRRTVRQTMVRAAMVALVLATIAWFGTTVQQLQRRAMAAQCEGHLAQFTLALHNYHASYGSFPPAHLADAEGRPIHSWRVLLLPFFEQQDLYNRYDFSEPWDGPNNRKLASKMPNLACPNH